MVNDFMLLSPAKLHFFIEMTKKVTKIQHFLVV